MQMIYLKTCKSPYTQISEYNTRSMKTCAVVLCGGVGERLWPYSTPEIPKQFQIFFQGKSLLDLTLERIRKIEPDKILLVTNERYREHINSIYGDQIAKNLIDVLYEPSAKGTSSSILYATLYLDRIIGESYKVCILPADHYFDDSFAPFLKEAMILNNNDRHLITTFGISPTNPDTGFGYIKHESGAITSFHEKPSLSRANELYFLHSSYGVYLQSFVSYSGRSYDKMA
jgi:mannose-1-phosphate guanylyltransferase